MGALLLNSDIRLFVAPVDASLLAFIEHTIVFWDCPPHNTRLKGTRPWPHIPLVHTFDGVSSWWGCGHAREVGKAYQGPQFCGPGTIREANIGL
ncbi:MAG TPA: hypothetical protein VJN18_02835 [Polyangiaceae bacterium]|nr:hypothetical protein [Polyangiaceae bacterium]